MKDFVDYTQSSGSTSGDLSNYYTKSQTSTLVNTVVNENNERIELESSFKKAYSTSYVESTRVSGKITEIGIWNNSSKSIKLFTKTFTYTGSLLTSLFVKDEINNNYISKEFTYVDGAWFSTSIMYGG